MYLNPDIPVEVFQAAFALHVVVGFTLCHNIYPGVAASIC